MSYYTRNDLFWLQGPNESIPIILTIEENKLFISRQNDALSSAAETKVCHSQLMSINYYVF